MTAITLGTVIALLTLAAVLYNIYHSHFVPVTSDINLLPTGGGSLTHNDPWVTLNIDLDAVNDGERQARIIDASWMYLIGHNGDPITMTPDDLGRGTTTYECPEQPAETVDGLATARTRVSVTLSGKEGIRDLINDSDTVTAIVRITLRDGHRTYIVTSKDNLDTSGVTLHPP